MNKVIRSHPFDKKKKFSNADAFDVNTDAAVIAATRKVENTNANVVAANNVLAGLKSKLYTLENVDYPPIITRYNEAVARRQGCRTSTWNASKCVYNGSTFTVATLDSEWSVASGILSAINAQIAQLRIDVSNAQTNVNNAEKAAKEATAELAIARATALKNYQEAAITKQATSVTYGEKAKIDMLRDQSDAEIKRNKTIVMGGIAVAALGVLVTGVILLRK